jgi:hypothetical protein
MADQPANDPPGPCPYCRGTGEAYDPQTGEGPRCPACKGTGRGGGPPPLWLPCDCGGFWCTLHRQHADRCPCPPIEELDSDPYSHPNLED